jgi:hypothetical protein
MLIQIIQSQKDNTWALLYGGSESVTFLELEHIVVIARDGAVRGQIWGNVGQGIQNFS